MYTRHRNKCSHNVVICAPSQNIDRECEYHARLLCNQGQHGAEYKRCFANCLPVYHNQVDGKVNKMNTLSRVYEEPSVILDTWLFTGHIYVSEIFQVWSVIILNM